MATVNRGTSERGGEGWEVQIISTPVNNKQLYIQLHKFIVVAHNACKIAKYYKYQVINS